MRTFEEDFDFEFEDGLRVLDSKAIRIDSVRTVTYDPNRDTDPKHQARIAAHQERVQRELREQSLIKDDKND